MVVEPAVRTVLSPTTWYPATVISRHDARVAAEVAGRIIEVAEIGTRLAEGTPAARLDPTLLRQELAEARATVAREEARLVYLDQEVKRQQRLARQNNAAQSQLDQAVAELGVTRAELAAARARVEQTRERLERTVVRAPFAGIVTERVLQAGEWAEPGDTVIRLVDPGALEVQVRVPAHVLRFIQAGTELSMQASPETARGRVATIVPVGDDRSRLYELRIAIADVPWPVGQSLRVAIPTAASRDVVAVPRDALVLRRDGASVYRVLPDGTADRVAVEPGIAAGRYIEVTGGIEAGDRVVTRGGERLRPGQTVSARPSPDEKRSPQ